MKRFADLVDGPRRGERIELQPGQRDFFVALEREVSFTLEPTPVTPCAIQTVRYCAMERGEYLRGSTEFGGEYQIEQWSVDGKRDLYLRHLWQEIAELIRRDNIARAFRVIESGGYLDV